MEDFQKEALMRFEQAYIEEIEYLRNKNKELLEIIGQCLKKIGEK